MYVTLHSLAKDDDDDDDDDDDNNNNDNNNNNYSDDRRNISAALPGDLQTNQRAEITAIIAVARIVCASPDVYRSRGVLVKSDSE